MGVELECFEHIDDFLQSLGRYVSNLHEYVHLRELEFLLVLNGFFSSILLASIS